MVIAIFENLMSHVFRYMNNWSKTVIYSIVLLPVEKNLLTSKNVDYQEARY